MPPARRIGWMTPRYLLCLFLLLAHGACSGLAHAQGQPQPSLETKNVLILHAHEANAPLFIQTDEGIARVLQRGGIPIVNQVFVYLDLRRNPDPEYRSLLVDEMHVRFSHRKVDAIVTMFPEALGFVLKECRDLFPDIPILALYLPEGFTLPKKDRRIIGHSAIPDIIGTVEIALRLFPGSRQVYVVSGTHELDRRIEDQARRDLRKWEGRLKCVYLSQRSFEDILTAVSNAPPGTLVLFLTFIQDTAGSVRNTANVVERLSQVSAAPIFGVLPTALGYGIVGGVLLDFIGTGERAGELILDILGGYRPPENIPEFLDPPSIPMFDWQQLRHWHLNESALPKGSIVVNKEFGLWDLRYYAIGALAFILAQSFLIVGLLIQRRRKESAEESLRQKTEELDQFFTVSLDLLCIANTDGYFLRMNAAWERALGYSREELMASRFLDFVHPDELGRTQEALRRLASQEQVVSFPNRYRCKDGGYRWLEWTATPANGMIYAAARDVTERLTTEAEAMQRRGELAHITRVATMGELTTSLAHEINQPLTAILSNAQAAQRFLSRAAPDISEVRQILDDIIRDDRRASEVVRHVRSLVRKDEPRQEWVDLNDTIRGVVLLLRGESLLQEFSVTMELSPDVKRIQGDYSQLQQVVLNLILNSAAAMQNAPKDQRKIIVRTAMPEDGTVRVSVTDFGTGIDENSLGRIFEPFYSTKPDGLGMGLSISQRIVRAHGGTLEASNNREGGATFSFSLPVPQGGPS
jgi:PAS domain S-box-containing protein